MFCWPVIFFIEYKLSGSAHRGSTTLKKCLLNGCGEEGKRGHWQRGASLAPVAGSWCFLVGHKQLRRTSTSDKTTTWLQRTRNRPLCNHVWAQTDLSILQATPFRAQKSDSCFFADYSCGLALVHPPVQRCRFPAIELPLLPKSIQLRVMLHFYELSPKAANTRSNSISLPSDPLTRMPTVPRGMFSLLVMSNKPNLLNYRCVLVGLWHWKAMTVENSTNNSFSF